MRGAGVVQYMPKTRAARNVWSDGSSIDSGLASSLVLLASISIGGAIYVAWGWWQRRKESRPHRGNSKAARNVNAGDAQGSKVCEPQESEHEAQGHSAS